MFQTFYLIPQLHQSSLRRETGAGDKKRDGRFRYEEGDDEERTVEERRSRTHSEEEREESGRLSDSKR